MSIEIRLAEKNEAAIIADMSRQTFYDTFASENSVADMDKFMSETFTKEALMKEVGANGNIFFLAFDGELPVGYARMRESVNPPGIEEKKSMEIARIYALQSYIGKGVGSARTKKCIAQACELDKEIIGLGEWEKKQKAIHFYRKWGFEKFGTHIFILGDDPQTDWLMKKELATGD